MPVGPLGATLPDEPADWLVLGDELVEELPPALGLAAALSVFGGGGGVVIVEAEVGTAGVVAAGAGGAGVLLVLV